MNPNISPDQITHTGTLSVLDIPCFVRADGIRVLSGRGVQEALRIRERPENGEKRGGYILPTFFAASAFKPFIDSKLGVAKFETLISYQGKNEIHGFEATTLVDMCDAVLEARDSGIKLTTKQMTVARQCEILVRSLAKTGIIALVDEATGFQEVRPLDALQKYLDEFMLQEHARWSLQFPAKFFQLLFQMMGWEWNALTTKKPSYIGKLINNLVYERLGPNILHELRERNPVNEKGNRTAKHHQFFTGDVGHPKLQEHLASLMALLRASGCNRAVFNRLVDVALPRFGYTIPLQLNDPEPNKRPHSKQPEEPSEFNTNLKGLLNVPPPKKDSDLKDGEEPDAETPMPKKPKSPQKGS